MILRHWSRTTDRALVIHHPRGLDRTEVPWPLLMQEDDDFEREVERIQSKEWIEPAAVDELVRYHEYLHAGS